MVTGENFLCMYELCFIDHIRFMHHRFDSTGMQLLYF